MRRALKGVRFIAVVTVVLLASLLTATVEILFRYLARLAGQDVRCRIARVFVCTAEGADTVLGFYTLQRPGDRPEFSTRRAVPKATPAPARTRIVFQGDSRYGGPQAICEPASSFAMRQSAMNRSRPSRPTPPGLEPPGASGYFSKMRGQSNGGRAARLAKLDCSIGQIL